MAVHSSSVHGSAARNADGSADPGREAEAGTLVGVDVGGTFTDLVALDPASGAVRLAKVPSTTDNQAFGVLAALDAAEVALERVALIVHGTTTTTNAVLERALCRTGLITTRGFRDVLELGRRTRPAPYGMHGTFVPLVPRDLRLEVDERVLADGQVRVPLDEAGVAEAARTLLARGCEAVVVHFLHAAAAPAHEARAAEIVRALWPNAFVCAAHELLSESREYERGVTAAVNASVQPLLARYLDRLLEELGARGYRRELLVVNGNGGMVSARGVAREAAKTVMSGPASGVMAAAHVGRRAGRPDLLTYDMGGTSTDVALIRGAEPAVTHETELEYGLPIHVPMVDVRTVGAGGGSIARITPGGLLAVGPRSAGSIPGPICYGRGGTRPTLADADALLGRLDASSIAGAGAGEGGDAVMERVRECFARELGEPLGLDALGAAAAVVRVADTRMAGAVRMESVSLGVDPRDFALFAFGGAGPLHACAIARELGIPTVLVPPRPGITNAIGCLVAELRHDAVNAFVRPLATLDLEELHALLARQAADGEARVREQQLAVPRLRHLHSVDMQFPGQTHLLRVPIADATPTRASLAEAFAGAYRARFRIAPDAARATLVNVNTSVVGERAPIDLAALIDPAGRAGSLAEARTGERAVHFDGARHATPVYRRERLPAGAAFEGPALVEQMDATTLVPPGDRVVQDEEGNLIVHVGENA